MATLPSRVSKRARSLALPDVEATSASATMLCSVIRVELLEMGGCSTAEEDELTLSSEPADCGAPDDVSAAASETEIMTEAPNLTVSTTTTP